MRSFKKFGVLAVVIFAISAIGTASASAAQFTASATGSLTGKATAIQTFTFNGGQVKCLAAWTSGFITSTSSYIQEVEVKYSGCTAFGFASVHISPARYWLQANGSLSLLNSITFTITGVGCSVTIPNSQILHFMNYLTNGSKMLVFPEVNFITYNSSGGVCGSSGSNGTYRGTNEYERVGGGTLSYDP